jgi:hypothetical protein
MAVFDTLHAARRLRDEAGQSQEAAETIADVIGEAVAPMVRLGDFVTRAEFHQALHAMEIRLGGLAVALTGIALAIAKLA